MHSAMSKAIIPLVLILAGCAAFLQGCGGGDDSTTTTTTMGTSIPDIAGRTADLSTLVKALTAADLVTTLSGKGPFTVFAPTDAAFDALPFNGSALAYLLSNITSLKEVLEYHVTSGDFNSSSLKNGEKIPMLAGGNTTVEITTAANVTTVKIEGGSATNKATVTQANIEASNGIVHIINEVLIPADTKLPSIPDIATSNNLTTLVTAVTDAGLADTLSTGGPFTVFAPTNAAFAALGDLLNKLLLPANKDKLTEVLKYHVHSGAVTSSQLKNGEVVSTLDGNKTVNITITGSQVKVNNATVGPADVYAVNGVVHVINEVLVPPGFVPPTDAGVLVV